MVELVASEIKITDRTVPLQRAVYPNFKNFILQDDKNISVMIYY